MTAEDLQQILEQYDLGELTDLQKIDRASFLQPSFIFTTTSGKYFLKQYIRWNENIVWGLGLIDYLVKNNYPANKVFLSKDGNPYVNYQDQHVAIFEVMDIPEQEDLTLDEAYDMGKRLGELHILGNDFGNIHDTTLDYMGTSGFDNRIEAHKDRLVGKEPVLAKIREYLVVLEDQKDLPRGVCHNEFTLEHVRFMDGKVISVIDWDLVGEDPLIYDLGHTLIEPFWDGRENFDVFSQMVKGYDSVRKLTDWEKSHLFEAVIHGYVTFLIWEWSDNFVKENGFLTKNLDRLEYLVNLGKEGFNKRLN